MTDAFDELALTAEKLFARLEEKGNASLTESERVFVRVWSAAGQIDNGGFDQFFYNSSGDDAAQTPAAFRTIGAFGKAEIIQRAIALFPGGIAPADPEARAALLDELPDNAFQSLEEEYYANSEDVFDLLVSARLTALEAE
jgi:hypothetical protein